MARQLPDFMTPHSSERSFVLNPDIYFPLFFQEAAELAEEIQTRLGDAADPHPADVFWLEEADNIIAIAREGQTPDLYWLDVALQCMTLDAILAIGGAWRRQNHRLIVQGGAGYKERWGPAGKPEGRGVAASSPGAPVMPGQEQPKALTGPATARSIFKRLRGAMPG